MKGFCCADESELRPRDKTITRIAFGNCITESLFLSSDAAVTAFSILLFTERETLSGFFLLSRRGQVFVRGVEVKAALHYLRMSTSESKML
jgi:hypothetical protein